MIRLKQAIVVEGKYDKIRLSGFLDALILPTDGFGIFRDKDKTALLKALAESRGLILLTDSDDAGFQIRSYIKNLVGADNVIDVYIPEIPGREKRKTKTSAAGLLGVEGLREEVLLAAFDAAGVTAEKRPPEPDPVTKTDLYLDGFIGTPDAAEKRKALCRVLGLPTRLNANTLPKVISDLFGRRGYRAAVEQVKRENLSEDENFT